MDLGVNTIEDFFLELHGDELKNQFPCDSDYVGRYRTNADIMYKNVHPLVEKGAMTIDGGCLNNHGVKHIKTVIQRVTQLIAPNNLDLSYYEIYVLLMGIHLHDIGNLTGRDEHEQKIGEIIEAINKGTASLGFEDEVEKECIEDIAEAHGGDNIKMINLGDRETILNHRVQKKMIAAIIRFADEISDDISRADRVPLQAGTLPDEAIIYHKYSYCLKTAEYIAESKIISYEFRVEEEDLKRTYSKKNKEGNVEQVYLIDEIYQRTMKTFLELIFCSKFFRPHIEIDRVRVEIKIKLEEKAKHGKNVIKSIQYDIGDLGYPIVDFKTLCPDIAKLTGEVLLQKLTDKQFENVKFGN